MKKRRAFAFFFLALFLFAALFPVLEAHHDCTGEDCEVCRVIAFFSRLLFASPAAAALVFFTLFFTPSGRLPAGCFAAKTPVFFKVKLLN